MATQVHLGSPVPLGFLNSHFRGSSGNVRQKEVMMLPQELLYTAHDIVVICFPLVYAVSENILQLS